jgi:hypothetical protein
MSSYAIIELERSGATDQAPPELDPEQQYICGQGFHRTWSILDHIAQLNGWQPLSSFCVGEDNQGNLSEQWYDAEAGLVTVSGLLNKFFSLMGQGAIVFLSSESQSYDPEPPDSVLSNDEVLLRKAIKSDQLFGYSLWDLRAYELILQRAVSNGKQFRICVG